MELKTVIAQLNAIYQKSKQGALTATELEERDRLRRIYLDAMKQQVRGSLESIKIIDAESDDTVKHHHDCDCGRHRY
jgi:uncharacterized protein YnzC (UPF0291/DUF896 family)